MYKNDNSYKIIEDEIQVKENVSNLQMFGKYNTMKTREHSTPWAMWNLSNMIYFDQLLNYPISLYETERKCSENSQLSSAHQYSKDMIRFSDAKPVK